MDGGDVLADATHAVRGKMLVRMDATGDTVWYSYTKSIAARTVLSRSSNPASFAHLKICLGGTEEPQI